jgi:hypothetical protein
VSGGFHALLARVIAAAPPGATWPALLADAVAAAQASGTALWVMPPVESLSPAQVRSVIGPFTDTWANGGPSVVGTGLIGTWLDYGGGYQQALVPDPTFADPGLWTLEGTASISGGTLYLPATGDVATIDLSATIPGGVRFMVSAMRNGVTGGSAGFLQCNIRNAVNSAAAGGTASIGGTVAGAAGAVTGPLTTNLPGAKLRINAGSVAGWELTRLQLLMPQLVPLLQPGTTARPVPQLAPGAAGAAGWWSAALDGVNDQWDASSATPGTTGLLMACTTLDNLALQRGLFGSGQGAAANGQWSLSVQTDGAVLVRQDTTEAGFATAAGAVTPGVPAVLACLWRDGVQTIYVNGQSAASRAWTTAAANQGARVGTNGASAGRLLGALHGAARVLGSTAPTVEQMHAMGRLLAYIGGVTYVE